MIDEHSIGILIFSSYFVLVLGLGLIASRFQRSGDDFWVAGRRFGLAILVVANMAAILNGGALISGAGYAAKFGWVAILPFFAFAIGIAIVFFWVAKKLRQYGGITLPDYMGDRFDSNFLRAWSALVVAVSSIIYLIAQIRGMAFVLESLLNVSFFSGLVIGTVIFVAYVALGGLLAVVWTNIAQFIFVWVGLVVLGPALYEHFGGWHDMIQKVEAVAPGWTSLRGLEWSWSYLISWHVIWCIAYCTRIELVTKVYAAKDHRIARYSLPITVLLVIVFLAYGNLYLGAAARVLVWDSVRTPDQAFPLLITMYLTPVVAAFVLTGIASAAMSTTDSLLLMSGSAVAHDILRKCIDEPRGVVRDERDYLTISRLAIVAVGVIAFMGAIPNIALLLRIVSFAVAIIGACFFFPLVIGLNNCRISRAAAIASSVGGVAVTMVWIGCTLNGVPWALMVHPGVPGLITSGCLMLFVNLLTKPVGRPAIAKFFDVRQP